MKTLPIIYRDEHIVAVDKPPGLHVHPTPLSPREDSCMRILRDQLGQWVYTVHRLDRATSGVLLFALSPEIAAAMIAQFTNREIYKRYLAVVRGYMPAASGIIDRPLREDKHSPARDALTEYHQLEKVEIPVPTTKFPTSRYALVEAIPKTGRNNQIRRHFAGISHPIIGDVEYGDGKHNRLFRERFHIHRLLLFAGEIRFHHPLTNKLLSIKAPLPEDFVRLGKIFSWQAALKKFEDSDTGK
jgi:tRNA pseudouridine65 synthase